VIPADNKPGFPPAALKRSYSARTAQERHSHFGGRLSGTHYFSSLIESYTPASNQTVLIL
jgi:hypothetical protein